MPDAIAIGDLAKVIAQTMSEYRDAVEDAVEDAVVDTAKETRTLLAATSPERTGRYAKSWKYKTERRGFMRAYIYNTRYQLTHLLEKGHAKRGGGRVAARPHIEFAEEFASQQLVNRIDDAVRKAK